MEDVFKFLLIAAAIVIGIARQFKKEAKKNADDGSAMPAPEAEQPLPENWSGTYGGYIPEGPQPELSPQAKQKKTSPKSTPFVRQGIPPMVSGLQEPDEPAESEFAIHSPEEARRAVIWSEILQRKY